MDFRHPLERAVLVDVQSGVEDRRTDFVDRGEHRPRDFEMAATARAALRRECDFAPECISVSARDGVVTLQGTAIWYYQRAAAERAVRFLYGVKGVRNEIGVTLPVFVKDLRKRINDALHHTVSLDARRIRVEVEDGIVTLSGAVRSSFEREDAVRAAWGAPGVRTVLDRLGITE